MVWGANASLPNRWWKSLIKSDWNSWFAIYLVVHVPIWQHNQGKTSHKRSHGTWNKCWVLLNSVHRGLTSRHSAQFRHSQWFSSRNKSNLGIPICTAKPFYLDHFAVRVPSKKLCRNRPLGLYKTFLCFGCSAYMKRVYNNLTIYGDIPYMDGSG